jgi:hypothetical protein
MGALKGLAMGVFPCALFDRTWSGLMFGEIVGLLVGGVYGGWHHTIPHIDQSTDRVGSSTVMNSVKAFLYIGLSWILIFVLLFPLLAVIKNERLDVQTLILVIFFGIPVIVPSLFWFGGMDFVLHSSLRLVLSFTGTLPLRLPGFWTTPSISGSCSGPGAGTYSFTACCWSTSPPSSEWRLRGKTLSFAGESSYREWNVNPMRVVTRKCRVHHLPEGRRAPAGEGRLGPFLPQLQGTAAFRR